MLRSLEHRLEQVLRVPQGLVIALLIGLPILLTLFYSIQQYNFLPLILVTFVVVIACILVLAPQYTIIYFLFLGYFFFPSGMGRLGGLVTLNWSRIVILTGIFCLYTLLSIKSLHVYRRFTIGNLFLLTATPWILYSGLSISWAASPVDAMRYYPKLLFCLAIALALLIEQRITTRRAMDYLLTGALLFALASTPYRIVQWSGEGASWFIGVFGRHSPKFLLAFIVLLSLSAIHVRFRRRFAMVVFFLSLTWLTLLLQRGAMLALAVGAGVYWFLSTDHRWMTRLFQGVLIGSFVVFIGWIMLFDSSFAEYMFIPNRGPEDLFAALFSGDWASAISVINFKGRLEMWSYALEQGLSILGAGMGSTSYNMTNIFGRIYEIHNDQLTYLIDGGYIGFALYWLMWLGMGTLAIRYRRSEDQQTRMLALLLGAYASALLVWGLVDHVVSYADLSYSYLYIIAALIVKRQRELETSPAMRKEKRTGEHTLRKQPDAKAYDPPSQREHGL